VENFVNVDEETPMNDTIEKFGIFAISVKIAHFDLSYFGK